VVIIRSSWRTSPLTQVYSVYSINGKNIFMAYFFSSFEGGYGGRFCPNDYQKIRRGYFVAELGVGPGYDAVIQAVIPERRGFGPGHRPYAMSRFCGPPRGTPEFADVFDGFGHIPASGGCGTGSFGEFADFRDGERSKALVGKTAELIVTSPSGSSR